MPNLAQARPQDLSAVVSLLASTGLPTEGIAEHLGHFALAWESEAGLVGSAGIEVYDETGLLRSVAVAPIAQGQGLGIELTLKTLEHARSLGLSEVWLLTESAEGFFPRFGFRTAPRTQMPTALQASAQLRGACPASATAMRLELLQIRPAQLGDCPAIAEIYNQGIQGRGATFETRLRSASDIEGWLHNPQHPVLVAMRAGEAVGWIAASSYRPNRPAYAGVAEFSVYVARNHRGQGVGHQLMAAFLPACGATGLWKVLSRIFPENQASRRLCRQFGFREVGIYQKHAQLEGVWRDVVIVERLLSTHA